MNDETPQSSSEQKSDRSSIARTEFTFINQLRERVTLENLSSNPSLIAGIGDDAAIIRSATGKNIVISTDMLVEDIDFRRETTPPVLLGHKALAVSLSDIAAMGARPRWSLLSVGVPEKLWCSDLVDAFYEGFFQLAQRYDVQLIGGDTSRAPEKLVIDSIVLGECESGNAVLRAGAQPGDQLFVTGSLGGAAAGFRLVERGAQLPDQNAATDSQSIDHLLLRQLRPEPRVGWGIVLGQEKLASAMIDLSDGLSSDVNHLCRESGVGAMINAAEIPIDNFVRELCGRRALDPLQLALNGGEDFELLFSVKPQHVARLPKRVDGVPITHVGEIRYKSEGVRISEASRVWELAPTGWDHFSRTQ
ncbi:MAG: thiamine-phosphate kinase [Pyrinomonadaceae bacterium]